MTRLQADPSRWSADTLPWKHSKQHRSYLTLWAGSAKKIPFVDLRRAYETVAEQVARQCVSLPIYPEMKDGEVDYVASTTAALLA